MRVGLKARNVVFALAGAAVLVLKGRYSGPFEQLVHSYAGNVSVSFTLYFAALSAASAFRRPRLAAALSSLAAVEAFEVTDGFGVMANVFDPFDLLANAAGVGLALVADLLSGTSARPAGRSAAP